MAYRIDVDEPVIDALVRITREQVTKACDSLDAMDRDPVESVHDVRKRCKKIRGLLRLVRGSFDGYSRENRALRDAARLYATDREAHVFPSTHADTVRWAAARDLRVGSPALRRSLEHRSGRSRRRVRDDDGRRRQFREALDDVAERSGDWELDDDGVDALAGGIHRSYRRGHEAFDRCRDGTSVARLHEWRKRAKYTRYHVRLLEPAAPGVLGPLEQRFHDLTDLLGDDHDLADLAARLDPPTDIATAAFRAALDARRAELQRGAFAVGRELYAEDPDDFTGRLLAYRAGATSIGAPVPGAPLGHHR